MRQDEMSVQVTVGGMGRRNPDEFEGHEPAPMPSNPVKSAARAVEVLELFAKARAPLRLREIWKLLDYPQSSTSTLLKSLVHLGYLNYDRRSKSYFPTPRVTALGDWIGDSIYRQGRLLELLDEVHEETGETSVLVAQNDLYVQYLRAMPGSTGDCHVVEGFMRVLTSSAAGLLLMSRMPSARVDLVCRTINIREPDRSRHADHALVAEQIDSIKRNGYCFVLGTPTRDYRTATLSLPLPSSANGIPLALSVCGRDERVAPRKSKILANMQRAIQRFERAA